MDMTLGFVSDLHGIDESYRIANYIEYTWHQDKDQDPFSKYNTWLFRFVHIKKPLQSHKIEEVFYGLIDEK